MKKRLLFVLIAMLAVALMFVMSGCGIAKNMADSGASMTRSENNPLEQQKSAEAAAEYNAQNDPDLSSVEETYTWPPRLAEGDEEPLMAEVDAIMRDNWEQLREYKADHGDGELELWYAPSERGSISDVVAINLMILADNGYIDYVQRRVTELEAYNKAFVDAGGELPEWMDDEIKDIKSYLK